MPMFFFSGALFPLHHSPFALHAIAIFDSLAYGVDGMRILLSNVSQFGGAADVTVLCTTMVLLLGLGSYRFERRIGMSAKPPESDIKPNSRHVRFVPIAEVISTCSG